MLPLPEPSALGHPWLCHGKVNKALAAPSPCLDLAGFGTQSAPRMASGTSEKPGRQQAESPRDERRARLAEALRDNLRKRKAQARGRVPDKTKAEDRA